MMKSKPDSLLTKPVLSRMDLLKYDARWIREGDYILKDAEDECMTKGQWQKWEHYLRCLEFAWRYQQVKNVVGETSEDINNEICLKQ